MLGISDSYSDTPVERGGSGGGAGSVRIGIHALDADLGPGVAAVPRTAR
jgi:hypothetical protein